MTTTTFVLNDNVISKLNSLRVYAEHGKNWSGLVDGRLKVTDFSHVIESGDFNASFSWVITADTLIRHLSVQSKKWMTDKVSRVDPVVAFTLAHLLGFTGAKTNSNEMVVTPPSSWKSGTYRTTGHFIVQQDVRKVVLA